MSRAPKNLRRALATHLCTPLATILFGMSLFLLLFIAWDEDAIWRRTERTYAYDVRFKPTDDGYERIDHDRYAPVSVTVRIEYITHEPRGLLAPISSVDRIVVAEPGFGFPPVPVADPLEAADLKARSLQHVTSINWQGLGRANIRPTGLIQRRVLWLGPAITVGIVVSGACLVISLVWIPRTVIGGATFLTTYRTRRARTAGRCPRCGYSVTGLLRCPECGRMIDR